MLSVTINITGRAVAGAALIGIAVATSSLGIVRAEREGVRPDTKVYNCTSGKACVEGNATGTNTFGVWGNSSAGTGVQGNSTATNNNSGVAGVNKATTGKGYGVYGRSSNGPGMYGTSSYMGVHDCKCLRIVGDYGAGRATASWASPTLAVASWPKGQRCDGTDDAVLKRWATPTIRTSSTPKITRTLPGARSTRAPTYNAPARSEAAKR